MLSLNEEQTMMVEMVRDIAEREFTEKAFEWDGEAPWENLQLLADRGFLGINLPEEYGGGGMSEFEATLLVETIGRVCPDTAYTVYNISMVAPRAIDMFGSEAAKERYLGEVCSGEALVGIAISEPEHGSDAGAMNTEIEERDGELYLSGEKIWVSYVPNSDAVVVWTRFPDGNLGTVIMEFDDPGVEIVNHFTNMAGHTQSQFYMEDVHIPEENVLVRGKAALKEQLKSLNWERCGSAAFTNSMAWCAFDKAREYAMDRSQFGQPIGEFQGIRWKLADMVKELEASRSLTYRAAINAVEHGRVPDRLEASIAKLYSGEMAEHVVSEALQIHGANGYQQGHPLEHLYRLQRGRRIAAGTDEIMKNNIADVAIENGIGELV